MRSKQLPQEVVEQILFKLPIESLIRCSSVSKQWYKMVSTFKPRGNNHTLFLFDFYDTEENDHVFRLNTDNNATFEQYALHLRNQDDTQKFAFECCANGLICFSDHKNQRVTLWNPSISRYLLLPKSGVSSMQYKKHVFGIVVDRVTNDYKILRTGNYFVGSNKVEVFRGSTGCWELLDCETPTSGLVHCQVDLGGMSYWVGVGSDDELMLVSFDGHEELFGSVKIDVPRVSESHDWRESSMYLLLLNESLVFIHSVSVNIEDDDSSVVNIKVSMIFIHVGNSEDVISSCKIWKLDCQGKSVSLWCRIAFDTGAEPLGFRENGELLWLLDSSQLISVDIDKGSWTYLGNKSANRIRRSFPNYVEGLALWNHVESRSLWNRFFSSDGPLCAMPPPSYRDRKTVMDECYAKKEELQSEKKFEALEAFLNKKKQGLTYKRAIEQLIEGSLDPTSNKDISKQISEYVAWRLDLSRFIMCRLVRRVENWDSEVIGLIVELGNNLKNIGLVIPGLEAIPVIGDSLLKAPLDEYSRGNLVEVMKKLVWSMIVNLSSIYKIMKVWAERPTKHIDPKSFVP